MKKIISILLTLCLLFSSALCFTSCEAFDTPETMVTKAVAKTATQDSYAGEIVIQMSMELFGEQIDIQTKSEMKAEGVTGDSAEVEMKTTVNAMGETLQTTTYMKDGWSYVVMQGEGYKTKNDEGIGSDDTVDSLVKEIPKDLFEGVEIVKDEQSGERSVTVVIPSEVFAELYDELVEEITSTMGVELEITVSDATVTISVKDGLISVYDIAFTMTMDAEGMEMSVDAEASVTFTQYGGVTVEMPENYESFPEQK